MDGDTGQGGPILRLQVELKRFILDIRHLTLIGELGGCPLTSHRAGRHAGGLQGPAWHPGEDAQARGPVKGSSQELINHSSPSPRDGGSCLRAQRRTSPS